MDRSVSPNEVKVIEWLLDHALVEVTAYRHQPVEQLRVVGGCGCGCTTLDFKSLGEQRGKTRLADELAVYPDGQQAGLILWGLEGEIVMLEVYDCQLGSSHRFPDVSYLCTWEELGRRGLGHTRSVVLGGKITREAAWQLLTEFTQSESLRKHALAVEACMRACSKKFADGSPDTENLWGVVGLIHDFDYERWPTPEEHPYKGNEILKERGYSDEIRRAIMSHAEYSGVTRDTPMEKALFACDELAGFITAVALIKPGKSLAEVDAKSVRKRMKDKAFARKVNRDDIIKGAAGLGVDLDEHIAFCIEALKPVAKELGLDGSAARG